MRHSTSHNPRKPRLTAWVSCFKAGSEQMRAVPARGSPYVSRIPLMAGPFSLYEHRKV
jgi:hypothetical protein